VNRRPARAVGREEDARTSKIIPVKTRSHRLVSLAVRIVPLAAVLAVAETGHQVLAAGPRLL
jgi:hypothetical protein